MQKLILELRQKRAKAIADGRAINERAIKDARALTTEESAQWDKFIKEADGIKVEIDRLERQVALDAEMAQITERDLDAARRNGGDAGADVVKRQAAAFRSFLTGGLSSLGESERRDLSVGSGVDGGFLVAPSQWVNNLIKFVDDLTFIRQKSTKHTLTQGESLGMPSLDTDMADADWTSEVLTGSAESTIKLGKRELKPSPLAKRIKVSMRLIERSSTPVEQLVLERIGYKLGVTEEKGFLTGNGVGKPLGVFTADDNGIGTARDVSSGANSFLATAGSVSQVSADALISMKFALKGQYWGRSEWLFHRDILAIVTKLKDANGQYLLRESLRAGEPDTLLGRPINMSEFAPNTNTTGLYIGLLGDFSFYHIVDALNTRIQRLNELYAETNQVGYIARAEVDGMPVLAEAFARLKNT